MEAEYSKRVYQGVRVKHTVKDLLAEKRSRQTNVPRYNGGSSPSQTAYVTGSHMLPGYYGMRRSFMSDTDLCHPSKQFVSDAYSSNLGSKSLSCEPPPVTGYPSLIDTYYSDSFGDYRGSAFTASGSSLFPTAAVPSLLPPFPGESSHFLLRDAWDQPTTDVGAHPDPLCADGSVAVQTSGSLSGPEPGSPVHYRSSSRGPGAPGTQPYSLHPLEDVHYSLYQPSSGYTCSPYMTNELASKMAPLTSEESDHVSGLSDAPTWSKDDGGGSWSPYEIRRAF